MSIHTIFDNAIEVPIDRAALLLDQYMQRRQSVMLWGQPGVGKTDVVGQTSKKQDRNLIVFRANLHEPVDMRGVPVPDLATRTTDWLTPAELPQVERDGERGTFFCDEINTASPQMQAVLFQLILEKSVGDYRLPEGWTVVAAGNRIKDRAAAQRMPSALKNRFAHIHVCSDVDAWVRWALTNNVPVEIIAFARFRPDLFGVMPAGDENAFLTSRSLTLAGEYVNAPVELRKELFAGLIGVGQASELEGFVQLFRSLGQLDDILADPKKARIPTEPSERYAVCTGLGRIVKKPTMPNLITYAKRLPREFQILAVTDATRRDESLKNTAAYGQWAAENLDIIK
jgi:hypothetical protein